MLKGDLTEFTDFEDKMTSKYPMTAAIHEHRQRPEWTCAGDDEKYTKVNIGDSNGHMSCDARGADKSSLFCALAYIFDHFAHDAVLEAYPEPKQPVLTPKSLIPLEGLTKAELKPSQLLRWLAMLVADIHQPLHLQRGKNDFGRLLRVSYQGEESTLSEFWENMPKRLNSLPSKKTLQRQFESRAPAWWDKRPTELFREWMNETSMILCHDILATLHNHNSDHHFPDESIATVTISEEVFQKWRQLAEDLTTLSGQRLAFLLSDILVHRKHNHAQKEGRGHRHAKRNSGRDFLINLAIAAVLVPSLWMLFRRHEQNPNFGLDFGSIGLSVHAKK
jgi:hypothetical protein